MNAVPEPPTKLVRFLCVLIGLGVAMPTCYRLLGKPGLVIALPLGAWLGWWLGSWVRRTFLEL